MKTLITGGAGFIGSHLAEKLIERDHTVMALDDLSTGRLNNVDHLQEKESFSLTVETVLEQDVLNQLVDQADQVYHLAAAVGVEYIINNPLEAMRINVDGTENVLEAANRSKTPVLLASTSEIYGKNESIPFSEDQERVLGSTQINRWSYSCTKALDEFMGLGFHRQKKLPVVIARFFNVVGPRQTGRYGMVIPRFVNQALMNRPITVYGDGKQTRVFMDVDDATDAIIELMNHEEAIGEPFNVGGIDRVSINELARKIIEKVNSNSTIKHIPYEEAYEEGFEDMRHRVPEINKIKNIIGFEPDHSLSEILDRIIEYFRSNEGFE